MVEGHWTWGGEHMRECARDVLWSCVNQGRPNEFHERGNNSRRM